MPNLGKYEIHEHLRRGGFGTVYRATETTLEGEGTPPCSPLIWTFSTDLFAAELLIQMRINTGANK